MMLLDRHTSPDEIKNNKAFGIHATLLERSTFPNEVNRLTEQLLEDKMSENWSFRYILATSIRVPTHQEQAGRLAVSPTH